MHGSRHHEVLKEDSVRDVFSRSNSQGRYRARQDPVSLDVIRMSGFLHPEGVHASQTAAHFDSLGQGPLLVYIHHQQPVGTHQFAQHLRSTDISLTVLRSNFQLEGRKPLIHRVSSERGDMLVVILEPSY